MNQVILDPADPTKGVVAIATVGPMGEIVKSSVMLNLHSDRVCAGTACVIHSPSDHHMRGWVLVWRDEKKLFERMCDHGIGHPDPDDLAYHMRQSRDWVEVHGCDGCCQERVRGDEN